MDFDTFGAEKWREGQYRVRKRNDMSLLPAARFEQVHPSTGTTASTSEQTPGYTGFIQETHDLNNGTRLSLKGKSDVGGPFFSYKTSMSTPTYDENHMKETFVSPYIQRRYGPIYPSSFLHRSSRDMAAGVSPAVSLSYLPIHTPAELDALGATAVSRTLPNVPDSPLSTTVAELIGGGLPSIIGKQALKERRLSSLGSEYLNFEFGIVPLVSDIQSLIESTQKFDEIIRQTKRDNKKLIRREVELVNDIKQHGTEVLNSQYTYPSWYRGTNSITRTTRKRVWFSGAYRYSYPLQLDGLSEQLRDFDRVYGLVPNWSTAWNAIPFSWLVDWQANIGDVVTNASYLGKDGLELVYGYIMSETTYTRSETFSGGGITTTCDLSFTVKHRRKANPFGFGVSLSSLTGKQSAILTALGLSRLKL